MPYLRGVQLPVGLLADGSKKTFCGTGLLHVAESKYNTRIG